MPSIFTILGGVLDSVLPGREAVVLPGKEEHAASKPRVKIGNKSSFFMDGRRSIKQHL